MVRPTAGCVVVPRVMEAGGGGGRMMLMEMVLLPLWPRASVAVTVNVVVPPAPGVPLITPVVALRLSPGGRVPEGIENVYGGVPPEAVTVCENADSTEPLKLPLVMATGVAALAMLIVKLFRAEA